jgi:DNA-binding beta-propeller fold protein YncE
VAKKYGDAMDSLPSTVQDALKKATGSATIEIVESLTKNGNLVAYEAHVKHGKKRSEIQVGESAVIADGLIYVNVEDTNEVVAFDPKSLAVKKRFPIGIAKTPTGLAYDAKTKRLFIGCRNDPKMVVMDAVSGRVIISFPIGRGVDYAGFDPQAKLIFFSCSEGVLNIFHEKSADDYEDAGAVKTQPSARTMAFDPKTKKIFLAACRNAGDNSWRQTSAQCEARFICSAGG